MHDDPPTLISILAGWFPMLLLIGVWIFFMSRMGNYRNYMTEHVAETKRNTAALERIAAALEKRQSP